MSREPLVHVLMNNWNGREDTLAAIEALYGIDYGRFVLILVDNGSTDGTADAVAQWCESRGVTVTRQPYRKGTEYAEFAARHAGLARPVRSLLLMECDDSVGFTGANNLSIEIALRAETDYVLFLNNDTEVETDFLTRLIRSAGAHPPAVWGCKITFYDPPNEVWFAGGHVNFWGVAIPDGEGRRADRLTGIRRTEMVSGCVMLIPRAVLERVGGQDDRYFFAVDDIEYSIRIGKAGFPLMIDLDAVVRHKVSRAVVNKRPLQLYYLTRNTLLWRSDHYSAWRNVPFVIRWVPRWLAELTARALKGQTTVSRGMWQGLRDFVARRFGECRHPSLNPGRGGATPLSAPSRSSSVSRST